MPVLAFPVFSLDYPSFPPKNSLILATFWPYPLKARFVTACLIKSYIRLMLDSNYGHTRGNSGHTLQCQFRSALLG